MLPRCRISFGFLGILLVLLCISLASLVCLFCSGFLCLPYGFPLASFDFPLALFRFLQFPLVFPWFPFVRFPLIIPGFSSRFLCFSFARHSQVLPDHPLRAVVGQRARRVPGGAVPGRRREVRKGRASFVDQNRSRFFFFFLGPCLSEPINWKMTVCFLGGGFVAGGKGCFTLGESKGKGTKIQTTEPLRWCFVLLGPSVSEQKKWKLGLVVCFVGFVRGGVLRKQRQTNGPNPNQGKPMSQPEAKRGGWRPYTRWRCCFSWGLMSG